MLSVIPSVMFRGLILSFVINVAQRLLAQYAHEDTHTHMQTRVQITIKSRLKHMCPSLLCGMTWTEDGRLIWLRETTREGVKRSDQRGSEWARACSLSHLIDLTLIERDRCMTLQRQIHISFPLSMEALLSPLYIHSNPHWVCYTLLFIPHTRTHRPDPYNSSSPPSLSLSVVSEVATPNEPFGFGTALSKSFASCGPCLEFGCLSLISCELIG